ncbi:cleavage polyadenylation factor subunit PTI1 KNAG_0J02680 [Huiozyma naganishii CBS 8797]|uniref:RRM domain-containing protein n=1 Tax=Huiozyma naganishii (strain ATCC MYA-139 / BCRC 22969 / CBS 8797 / KCTC 17520 / NBRC 10181 / NCYC 3082 / Yp74L-3) TaxID=1071383 RepID=J7S306_HUIN7|nr:hypothetical protein KNAG_0J02680 [Kazachstania naganishii CBS 8797]CCK72347.1 hypothetical protein KNAG_0J02680 [Kazachstania naganishii CBS 8797]
MSVDPRKRKSRHVLTPDNLSTAIQVSNLPADWTQDIASSVVAGSGPVVDIAAKTDPRTGKLNAIVYEYQSSRDCEDAYALLTKIQRFPCTVERIIPSNYKDRLQQQRDRVKLPELELKRDLFPWELGLELPFQMVTNVPIPRKPNANVDSSSNNNNNNQNIVFPDILSKASSHLPQFQSGVLTTPDPVSQNLSKIPPLQLIEFISNLKILANQGKSKRVQLEQFLMGNNDLVLSISQALLEMGFITQDVVGAVIMQASSAASNTAAADPKLTRSGSSSSSSGPAGPVQNGTGQTSHRGSSSSEPTTTTATTTIPAQAPIQPPFAFPAQQSPPQQQQRQQFPPQQVPAASPPPLLYKNTSGTANGPMIDILKLHKLPQQQQDMIKQVLTLSDAQVRQLPPDQQTMVSNLKEEYLL